MWRTVVWRQFGAAIDTRAELQDYLAHGRRKCQATITSLTDEQLGLLCRAGSREMPFAELLLYPCATSKSTPLN